MNFDKLIGYFRVKSDVIFLSEMGGESQLLPGIPVGQALRKWRRSFYFNIVESMNSTIQDIKPLTEQAEGETQRVFTTRPRQIIINGWICQNTIGITKYLNNVIMAEGIHQVDSDPFKRKERLEEWKEKKTPLTLYGITEKNENLVITSLSEIKDSRYDPTTNINIRVGLSQIKGDIEKPKPKQIGLITYLARSIMASRK